MSSLINFFLLISIFCFCEDLLSQSITWQRTYGFGNIEAGYSIVETPDSGFIVVGRRRITSTNYILAIRLNKLGDTLWTRIFAGFSASQIEKVSDDNYIICGSNLIKININGDTIWLNAKGAGMKLKETSDKGFIICDSESKGPFRFYPKLKRVDPYGNIIWEKIFMDSIYDGRFSDIIIDNQNNFVMTGNFSDSLITDYLFVMKTDSLGNTIWFKRLPRLLYSRCIITKNNNYIIGGRNAQSGNVAFLMCLNNNGTLSWLKNYDKNLDVGDCFSIVNASDGGITFAGFFGNENFDYFIRLIKTDQDGNEQWRKLYGFGDADFGYNLRLTTDNGYVIAGSRDNYELGDVYVVKADSSGYAIPPVNISNYPQETIHSYILLQNYPNPFNPTTQIKYFITKFSFVLLRIYDINGTHVKDLVNNYKTEGAYEETFDGTNLPSGVYFSMLIVNNKPISCKKMILVK